MKEDICSAVFSMTYTKACKHIAQVQAPAHLRLSPCLHAACPRPLSPPLASGWPHPPSKGGRANTNITQVTTEATCKCNVSRSHIKKVKETGKINLIVYLI